NWNRLDWLPLHVYIPNLDRQVVASKDIPAVMGESNVGEGRYDFREERSGRWVFFLFEPHTGKKKTNCKQ
ncbi:hypothetical protein OFB58_27705, partial [Escherichia coli]|nr:hypothetical protein [Escherichia coli]